MAILRFQVKLVRSADALLQKFMTRSIIYVNYTAVFVPQTFVLAKEYVGKQLKWNEKKIVQKNDKENIASGKNRHCVITWGNYHKSKQLVTKLVVDTVHESNETFPLIIYKTTRNGILINLD